METTTVTDYRWRVVAGTRIDHRVASSDPKWIGKPRYTEIAFDHPIPGRTRTRSVPELRGGAFEAGIRAISVASAAYGHADGLVVTLGAEDRELIIDPATDRGPSADAGTEGVASFAFD